MSYSILYDKQFVKVGDKVIPMQLAGCNNVYEASSSGRKRARDWNNSTYVTEGKILATPEEILKNIDAEREKVIEQYKGGDDPYTDRKFGWFTAIAMYGKNCGSTTFKMYRNFYANGIKEAKTIEELAEYGIGIELYVYYWEREKFEAQTGLAKRAPFTFHSTSQVEPTIKEWTEYYGNKASIYLRLTGHWNLKRMRKVTRPARVKKARERVPTKEFFVLECLKESGFFLKNTRNGYRYSYYKEGARKWLTEKEAATALSKMRNKNYFRVRPASTHDNVWV